MVCDVVKSSLKSILDFVKHPPPPPCHFIFFSSKLQHLQIEDNFLAAEENLCLGKTFYIICF